VSAHPEDELARKLDHLEDAAAFRLLNTLSFALRCTAHRPLVDHWIVASPHMQRVYGAAGIEASVLRALAEPDSAPLVPLEERSEIVFTGRLTERKGVHDVLEVARARPALSFTIAGTGPLEPLVESAARSMPNLRYLGFVDRGTARAVIRSARAVLVPSRWAEPAGLVALEAMAVGTPVVGYRRGGLADYVRDTGGGLVTDVSASALAAALDRLCDGNELWESCSNAGLDGLRRHHDPEAHLSKLESIYGQVSDRDDR
jgi:glycosyltransferase involved in cell wall biosynthesis